MTEAEIDRRAAEFKVSVLGELRRAAEKGDESFDAILALLDIAEAASVLVAPGAVVPVTGGTRAVVESSEALRNLQAAFARLHAGDSSTRGTLKGANHRDSV